MSIRIQKLKFYMGLIFIILGLIIILGGLAWTGTSRNYSTATSLSHFARVMGYTFVGGFLLLSGSILHHSVDEI